MPFSDVCVQFAATATTTGTSRSVSSLALDRPRLALSMVYGYPANAGYRHERPFDYFRFESSISPEGIEQLLTRSLTEAGDSQEDLWGAIRASSIHVRLHPAQRT